MVQKKIVRIIANQSKVKILILIKNNFVCFFSFFFNLISAPVDTCSLKKETGMCRAAVNRYYFNSKTSSCESFIYGGCGGNSNNFSSKEKCENRCKPQQSKNLNINKE